MSDYKIFYKILQEYKPKEISFKIWKDEIYDLKRKYYLNLSLIDEEKWKEIEGTNYMISSHGRVKNKTTNKIKENRMHKYGQQVVLWSNGQGKTYTISRLVANYFIRKIRDDEITIHINDDILNNYYKNLKIVKRRGE